jgi:hypothetical protein
VETVPYVIFGLIGLLLLFAAVMDVRWRTLPWAMPLSALCLGAAFFVMRFWVVSEPAAQPTAGVLGGAATIVVLGIVALVFGLIGLSDIVVVLTMVLLVLGLDASNQVLLAILAMSGTSIASLMWFLHRARTSMRISGPPKNMWDVMALFKGRIEIEPHLRRYPDRGRRGRRDGGLTQLEANRTPDGSHLYRDPCPFTMCLFVGYCFLLIGVLWGG